MKRIEKRIEKRIASIIMALALSLFVALMLLPDIGVRVHADVGDFIPESDYLTFTAEQDGSSVTMNIYEGSLRYRKGNDAWKDYTAGTTISLNNGESVRFRGNYVTFDYYNHVSITGKVACSGNIMSLRLDGEGKDQGLSDSCFEYMFEGCTGLTTAPALPATILADWCYADMFNGCTGLTKAPALPATTLAKDCYYEMFRGCAGLTTAPALPATTLADYCYCQMFWDCTGLKTAPTLPATTLADYCYYGMFYGCTGLTTAPELSATTLADSCYAGMFYGCTGIKLSTTRTDEYNYEYRVPSSGTGTTAVQALDYMFSNTGGTFTGTPEINKTYYMKSPVQTTLNMYYDLDDEGNVVEKYFIAEGANATVCEIITPWDASSQPATWADGTAYLFGFDLNTGDETYTYNVDRVTVSGDVKLIVLGGCTLNFTGGINVPKGSSLTICGPGAVQCGDEVPLRSAGIGGNFDLINDEYHFEDAGTITIVGAKVTATGNNYAAGIGGSQYGSGGNIRIVGNSTVTATGGYSAAGIGGGYDCSGGRISIEGGIVTATGGDDAAGIGGGCYGDGGTVTISGGKVTAIGGDNGAGIGGGAGGSGGSITISGGTVTASGKAFAAGIGGGKGGNGGEITISAGTVIATGNERGAAIGGGWGGNGGTITISGGDVTATTDGSAAGIGGGCEADGGKITISGGKVTACGGDGDEGGCNGGAGIGGGYKGACGEITIEYGTIKANGGYGGSGIGGGYLSNGGIISISGGSVTASGDYGGAGIGAGVVGKPVTIVISGGTVKAACDDGGAGIGGGFSVDGGDISISGGNITATGGYSAAGIGGGQEATGGTITISGGTVTTTGGHGGAGIGGGAEARGGNITITDGKVTAQGGMSAAGIGGGCGGYDGQIITDGAIIKITGGEVTATGGGEAAGIGGGVYRTGGSITISGGTVTATGTCGDEVGTGGAGIGGGYGAGGGVIVIQGGVVTADGGDDAAGIGGGSGTGGSCGEITINGGYVTANGSGVAGIGGGGDGSEGKITILRGTVTANGGIFGAGIGGCKTIIISGGNVTATGGAWGGAGIGSGLANDSATGTRTIKISGGKVIANKGELGGTGIGSGNDESGTWEISIDFTDDSSVYASGYEGTVTLLSDAVIRETTAELPAGTVSDLDVIADKTLVKGPLCGIKLNSANIEFKGLIRMRMAFTLPEDFVGREDVFVVYYLEGEHGLVEVTRIALKDGTEITGKSGNVSYGYYCPVRTKQYADNIHIRILDANGEPMAYTAGSSWAGIDYTYSAKKYAETVLGPNSTSSQKMKDLALAFIDYGTAAKIYFDYDAEGCEVSDRVTAVTANDMGDSTTAYGDSTKELGVKISINLDFKEDNSLYVYFTLPAGKTASDYTFTIKKGDTVQTVTAALVSGRKYQVVVRNIAAKNLADFYEFTITDKATLKTRTVRASAISYAKTVLETYENPETHDQTGIEMVNLAKALYLYNKAAIAYFTE